VVGDYFASSNMRYASVCDYLHLHRAMPLYVEWPLELLDHNQGIDMVYLPTNQLAFLQSKDRSHLLQNFDSKD
jgi:hypothetical protein